MPSARAQPSAPRPSPPAAPSGRDPDDERRGLAAAVDALRRDPRSSPHVWALAARCGVTPQALRALLRRHYQATPEQLRDGARVARLATLLAAGERVGDAAEAAGFPTLDCAERAFLRGTRLTPAAFRALPRSPSFTLALPRGYLPGPTLRNWGRDPQSLTERVEGGRVLRAYRVPEGAAVLEIELARAAAHCRVESTRPLGGESMRAAHRVALRSLGLASEVGLVADPAPFERRARCDPAHARLIGQRRGLRIPLTADAFEALVWAVLGQQVNLAFAFTMRRRLLARAGTPGPRGLVAHPTPERLAAIEPADLVQLQLSRRKAEFIVGLAAAVANGELPLAQLGAGPASVIEETLLAHRGVGPWTAHYVMLRGYGLADCVPLGDAGLNLALQRFFALPERPDAATTVRLMAAFAPHRSLATFHLWMSLGDTP